MSGAGLQTCGGLPRWQNLRFTYECHYLKCLPVNQLITANLLLD
jgi:hypothetical protein